MKAETCSVQKPATFFSYSLGKCPVYIVAAQQMFECLGPPRIVCFPLLSYDLFAPAAP